MAPHGDQVDPRTVTPAAYRSVLAAARDRADLVVVDTQIVEDGVDTTGLIDELLVPALRDGGWGLAVADTSAAGLTNTLDRVRAVHRAGVPPDRLMALLSRVPRTSPTGRSPRWPSFSAGTPRSSGTSRPAPRCSRRSTWAGSNTRTRRIRPVLDTALLRVTGDPAFQPAGPVRSARRWRLRIGARR